MKKFLIFLLTLLILIGGFLFYVYETQMYSFSSFPKNTSINGVDCSGLTVKKAAKKITTKWNNQTFYFYESKGDDSSNIPGQDNVVKSSDETLAEIIKENTLENTNHGKNLAKLSNLGFKYDISSSLKSLLRPSFINAIKRSLHLNTSDLAVRMVVKDSSTEFKSQFKKLSLFKEKKNTIKTKNAQINFSSDKFEITKEVYGTDINKKKVLKAIYKNVSEGKFYLNYKASDYYNEPTILSTNRTLVKEQEYLTSLSVPSITYKMPSKTFTLGKNAVVQMYGINAKTIKTKMNEKSLTVDKKAVKRIVQKLANKYNTVGKARKFKSSARGVVTISGGDYGYAINVSSETKKLIKSLTSKNDVNRSPVYSRTGYKGAKDIGNSYVEIDIKNQKLWMYKNGKLITSFSVVTGSENAGHGTGSGVFYLKWKTTHTTLKGSNGDGSTYASPVNYWMPFNGGEGIHDASWRSNFGGKIYLTSGSHGCVNCPTSKVGKVYKNIEAGYPIIVFR